MSRPNPYKCNVCGDPAIVSCSRCMCVYYCGLVHQQEDWKVHRPTCQAVPTYAPLGQKRRLLNPYIGNKTQKPFRKEVYDLTKWMTSVVVPTIILVILMVLIIVVCGGLAFVTPYSLFGLILIFPICNIYLFFLCMYEPVFQIITNLSFYALMVGGLSFCTVVCGIMCGVDGSFDGNWQWAGTVIVFILAFTLRIVAAVMCTLGRIEFCITERKCCFGAVTCPCEWHGKTRKAIMMTRSLHLAGVFVHCLKVIIVLGWFAIPPMTWMLAIAGPINALDIFAIVVNRVPDVIVSIIRCILRLQEPDDPPANTPLKKPAEHGGVQLSHNPEAVIGNDEQSTDIVDVNVKVEEKYVPDDEPQYIGEGHVYSQQHVY